MISAALPEPGHVDEPQQAGEYAAVLSQVAAQGQPVIVRRNGEDLAAVVSLAHLELMREVLATQVAEKLAGQLDIDRLSRLAPPDAWLAGDEPKPF
jgi:PHD/YefM family antitoxin component YafN of YafNO toxin-antitoxin module